MKIVGNDRLRSFVTDALKEGRSPESIAGRLKYKERDIPYVSKEGIRTFVRSVYGRRIEAFRNKLFGKKKRRKKPPVRGRLDGRKNIAQRPKVAERRERMGDVEADFILSGKDGRGILLTVADRRSRTVFIERILTASVKNMERAFVRIRERFPEMKTITTDNDLLFVHHKRLEKLLGVKIYFCDAYASWQKGTIERANREIRRYIPKGSDISFYSSSFVKKVERTLNERWMKVLSFSSPEEVLHRYRALKKRRTGA